MLKLIQQIEALVCIANFKVCGLIQITLFSPSNMDIGNQC